MALLPTFMVLIGMALLAASLPSINSILRTLGSGRLRTLWRCLRALIILFIVGYAAFGLLHLGAAASTADMIVSAILMMGGAFVLTVAKLSDLTTSDIVRMATLERDVVRDALTGVFNRRYLDEKLEEEFHRSNRSGAPLSALMIDLDHFKHVNDTYGHSVGDQVIRHVSSLIAEQVRAADTVVRYGGEEFLVLLPDSRITQADQLGKRMLRLIAERHLPLPDGSQLSVTVSIGAAMLGTGDTAAAFLERADQALYAAKRSGRNRLSIVHQDRSAAA